MITGGLAEDFGQRLARRAGEDDAEVAEGEHDWQEEGEAEEATARVRCTSCWTTSLGRTGDSLDANTGDPVQVSTGFFTSQGGIQGSAADDVHGARDGDLGSLALLRHGRQHAGGAEAVGALDEAEDPLLLKSAGCRVPKRTKRSQLTIPTGHPAPMSTNSLISQLGRCSKSTVELTHVQT